MNRHRVIIMEPDQVYRMAQRSRRFALLDRVTREAAVVVMLGVPGRSRTRIGARGPTTTTSTDKDVRGTLMVWEESRR